MSIKELSLENTISQLYQFKSGTIATFDNYMVTEFKEGILLDQNYYLFIANIIQHHYGHLKRFGLISNRIFNYAMVPTDLMQARNFVEQEIVVAHVNYTQQSRRASVFEKKFTPYKVELFENLSDSLQWIGKSVEA